MCQSRAELVLSIYKGYGMKVKERFWAIFDRTITAMMALAAALVVLDALAVTIDVLMRKFFGITCVYLFEMTEFSLLWMTFLGTAWIMKNNNHIRVDLVVNRLNPRHGAIVISVASILSILVLMLMTGYSAWLTWHDYQTHFILSTILRPLKWPVEIIIPIGFFLLIIQLMRDTYGQWTNWKAFSKRHTVTLDGTSGGEL
jgi:C4-dicarboxylate transporter DctQ subunit